MDGREGTEVVVWREVRDLYRVDVVVVIGRRAGVMGGSGVAGGEVGPHSKLELAVTFQQVGRIKLAEKGSRPVVCYGHRVNNKCVLFILHSPAESKRF